MQSPTSPLNFACAVAAKAAISSWRTWMNCRRSLTSWKAPAKPLMPSPG